jgi:hypothetical protein
MMAANCTGVPRTRCTARPMPPGGDRSESSNPPPGLQGKGGRGGASWRGSGRHGGRAAALPDWPAAADHCQLSMPGWLFAEASNSAPTSPCSGGEGPAHHTAPPTTSPVLPAHISRTSTGSAAPLVAPCALERRFSIAPSPTRTIVAAGPVLRGFDADDERPRVADGDNGPTYITAAPSCAQRGSRRGRSGAALVLPFAVVLPSVFTSSSSKVVFVGK